jgi:Carboxypeptidase regulatory-like domain
VPGPLHYEVRAPDHGVLRGQLTLVAGANPPVELRLPPACAVTGLATDLDGQPAAGVRIVANDASGKVASTRTGADGSYRLEGLPPGRLALVAQARAADRTELMDAAEVELAPTKAPTWNPHLQPVAAGRQLRSQLVDSLGRPLAGYELVARGRGQLAAKGRTGADGTFTIGAPGPGLVDLRAFAPGRETNQFADAVWPRLDPANPPPRLRLDPVAFGTVLGRVETASRQPMVAKLGVWHEQRGEYVEYRSGADGTFQLAGVPPGRVSVTAEAAGLPACHRHDVNVPEGAPVELSPIVMAAGARLTIVVTDPSGAPAIGCALRLLGAAGPLSPTEEDGGTHRFEAVPAGEWQLQVSGRGFAAVAETLLLQAGDDLQRAVHLEVGSMRRVLVAAPPDAGDRVTLRVQRQGQTTSFQATAPVARATPTATGSVVFEVWMTPGSHDVAAIGSAGWTGRDTVAFGSASGDVTIPLRAAR